MKYLFGLFTLIFLTSCTTKTVVLLPEYEDEKILGKDLTIIRLFDQPLIANLDDVVDDLGPGVPLEVYNNYFDKNFSIFFGTTKCFKNVNYIKRIDKTLLEENILEISDKEKMKIMLPKNSNTILLDSIKTDFILFVDNLMISRQNPQGSPITNNPATSDFPKGGSLVSKLYHQLYFAIWDNNLNRLVSYGRVEDNSDFLFQMTKGNWDLITQNLGRKILKISPFSIRHALYYSGQ